MRFRELYFPAFGPFTDFRLEFASEVGLHLIYGPNESGKSSALRAVRGLLYGIPGDGRDEFLHPADALRLKACLEHSKGGKLVLGRRKGRGKKTLLDEEGKPLEGELLEPYLGGVDGELFDRLYGLDHHTLSQGGKALLEEGGKIGESLFAAGLGPGFRRVRDDLKDDAEKLWKPKSRTLEIDRAVEAYRKAQKRAADLSVSAENWRKISTQMEEEEERAHALEGQIRVLDADKRRLSRHLDAHRPLAMRAHLLGELAALGELPDLPPDFSERRQAVGSALAAVKAQLARVRETERTHLARQAELPAESNLLIFAPRIDRLHRSLDAVAEAEAALPVTRARADSITRRLRAVASDLGLNGGAPDGQDFPDAPKRARVRRLAERFRRLVDQGHDMGEQLVGLRSRQAQIAEQLAALGESRETAELENGLRRLRGALGFDTEVASLESQLFSKQTSLDHSLSNLPQWSGSVEELVNLRPPDALQLVTFERRLDSLNDELKQTRKDREASERRGKTASRDLAQLRDRERVRSRADLRQARQVRDEHWNRLISKDSRDVALQAQVERSLRDVDDLTDLMLDNAARVADLERINQEYHAARKEWKELNERCKELEDEWEEAQQAWRDLWRSHRLHLGAPGEMRTWMARRDAVMSLALEVSSLRERLAETLARRGRGLESHRQLWREPVGEGGLGNTVQEAIDTAERALAPLLEVQEQRKLLEAESGKLRLAISDAETGKRGLDEALETWRAEWAEVVQAFHREASADPTDLESLLERYEELRTLSDEAERADRELTEQLAASESFRQQMEDLAQELGEPFNEADMTTLIERLVENLAEARKTDTLRQSLTEQLEMIARERQEAERILAQRESEWGELLREAGAAPPGARKAARPGGEPAPSSRRAGSRALFGHAGGCRLGYRSRPGSRSGPHHRKSGEGAHCGLASQRPARARVKRLRRRRGCGCGCSRGGRGDGRGESDRGPLCSPDAG